jgi:hypothetical protein
MSLPVFKSSNEFSLHIEKLATEKKISYLDAIMSFCETHMIEPDEIANKISRSLKEKLEGDFRKLNYLPKRAELDL